MNRPIAVALALLAFALFCFFCIRSHALMIQHDIMARISVAISASAIPAGGISVDGRDVLLAGPAGSAIVSDRTRFLVSAVEGVRLVDIKGTSAMPAAAAPQSDTTPDARTKAGKAEPQLKLDTVLQTRIVEFNTASADLTATGRETLDQIAPILAATPALLCNINGFTDSTGDRQQNLELSRRRALATKGYLVQKGITASRLTAEGFGDADPIASNSSLEGRRKNRRIEFRLKERN